MAANGDGLYLTFKIYPASCILCLQSAPMFILIVKLFSCGILAQAVASETATFRLAQGSRETAVES